MQRPLHAVKMTYVTSRVTDAQLRAPVINMSGNCSEATARRDCSLQNMCNVRFLHSVLFVPAICQHGMKHHYNKVEYELHTINYRLFELNSHEWRLTLSFDHTSYPLSNHLAGDGNGDKTQTGGYGIIPRFCFWTEAFGTSSGDVATVTSTY